MGHIGLQIKCKLMAHSKIAGAECWMGSRAVNGKMDNMNKGKASPTTNARYDQHAEIHFNSF